MYCVLQCAPFVSAVEEARGRISDYKFHRHGLIRADENICHFSDKRAHAANCKRPHQTAFWEVDAAPLETRMKSLMDVKRSTK
ncbi:hypothetical protein OUZ56_021091 [Daphnia magna]|uniref:Uncharacterized protein n=1 Tax=Daphnia magna TaxID=35525 RepID=A0ABQ9ZGG9_9CRUS|nr:hypothetical protein OUZ56_021091 [Daphnia magna]